MTDRHPESQGMGTTQRKDYRTTQKHQEGTGRDKLDSEDTESEEIMIRDHRVLGVDMIISRDHWNRHSHLHRQKEEVSHIRIRPVHHKEDTISAHPRAIHQAGRREEVMTRI